MIFVVAIFTGYLHNRSHKKTILSLYQVDVRSKHAQKEDAKHLNSTERYLKGRNRAIYVSRIQNLSVLSTFSNKMGRSEKTVSY